MLTIQQKNTIDEYAEVKSKIKELEAKADLLNPEVLEIMRTKDVEEIVLETGKLTLGARRTWKYSSDIQSAEKFLKEKKKIEEQTGKADYEEKKYLIFKGNREVE